MPLERSDTYMHTPCNSYVDVAYDRGDTLIGWRCPTCGKTGKTLEGIERAIVMLA
jgi:hypothetical protein